MYLGEIIKEYGKEYSMTQFIKDSGLSKTYVYDLIRGTNKKGEPITPSIETIKKVSKGMHLDFDALFNRLDYDFVIRVDGNFRGRPKKEKEKERPEIRKLIAVAKSSSPENVVIATKLLKSLNDLYSK